MTAPHERYRAYLASLTPATLSPLSDCVTYDVRFKDPFNDVRGVAAMTRVFRQMFQNVEDIRFDVQSAMSDGQALLALSPFQGRLGRKPWPFEGTGALFFTPHGRVAQHIDHWDAAGNFYDRLPIIGWLLSGVRRRLSVR